MPPGRRAPSYKALYHLLGLLDPNVLAETLQGWLTAHHGTLPRALALDGKYIRDLMLTLALSEHESGAPVAITIASKEPKNEASKTEGELTAAKRSHCAKNALRRPPLMACGHRTLVNENHHPLQHVLQQCLQMKKPCCAATVNATVNACAIATKVTHSKPLEIIFFAGFFVFSKTA